MSRNVHLVIPCYNEERRLPFAEIDALLQREPGLYLTFSDDGSTDGTAARCTELARNHPERVLVHVAPKNGGKGEAVRRGMLAALERWPNANYIGYFDADLATPLTEAFHLLANGASARPTIIMGSRIQLLGSTDIRRSIARHYMGRVFATMVSMQLDVPVYDTQCGAKLIRADRVQELFTEPFLTRWLFDVELLWRCMAITGRVRLGEQVKEVPLTTWHEVRGSKVKLSDGIKVPLALLRVARHYRGRVRS
ncbi:MAG: glycosyltransferase family 2 protein [Flavobacteriales bacterium]|jgi:glycosyltransferase involved in cell wall biosynthesis|nr:glycosyltransferase family 2 protein [Flavobacteriales bacterium]